MNNFEQEPKKKPEQGPNNDRKPDGPYIGPRIETGSDKSAPLPGGTPDPIR